jgi:hypothetical protein
MEIRHVGQRRRGDERSMRDLSATEHTDWIFSSGELPTLVIRSILLAIVRT